MPRTKSNTASNHRLSRDVCVLKFHVAQHVVQAFSLHLKIWQPKRLPDVFGNGRQVLQHVVQAFSLHLKIWHPKRLPYVFRNGMRVLQHVVQAFSLHLKIWHPKRLPYHIYGSGALAGSTPCPKHTPMTPQFSCA